MRHRTAPRAPRDRGVAAVEFALLLPMLLLLIFGIIDFGRALNAQITLTQAAREGARIASVDNPLTGAPYPVTTVQSVTVNAATGLSGVTAAVTNACQANSGLGASPVAVKASYSFTFVTPVSSIARMFGSSFGSGMTLTATGVMPCET